MPIFDGDNLTITLDSGITSVDIVDNVYEPWKDWMLSSTINRKYPQAFRSDGGSPLSSIINQGSYIFLNNSAGWRIKPPEEDITIYFTGNLAVEDTELPAFISTIGSYTAAILGLQPVTQGVTPAMGEQLEYSAFQDTVTIDVISGSTGTAFPIGTSEFPVNNITDAHAIADSRGFIEFFIKGDLALSSDDFSDGHLFKGTSLVSTLVTIASLVNITSCRFTNMSIQGTMDNEVDISDCLVGDISYFNGFISDSALSGTVTLGGNVSAHIYDCKSGLINSGTPTIDMGGSGQSLSLRGHNGDVLLTNKSGPDRVDINISAGTITLDSTVTDGLIIVQGVGRLIDNSTGTTVVVNELVNGAEIANLQRVVEMQRAHHTATGDIWYWDPVNGDDSNDGKHISRSVATFAQAHSLATDNNHDLILAIPGSTSGITLTTENLMISKNYLFLRGPGRDFNIKSADDNLDAISITGDGVEVSSMTVSTSSTNIKEAIHTVGNFSYLHNLWVADAVNGILFENGEYGIAENVKMHHNLGYGLKFSGTAGHVDIVDCHIGSNYLDNVIIDLDGSDHEVNFLGDTVIHSSVTGYGISIGVNSRGVIIHDEVTVFNNFAGDINDLGANTYNQSDILEGINGRVEQRIYIDTELASAGKGFQQLPHNNWADAIDDAENLGLKKLTVLSDATVDRQIKNFEVLGVGLPAIDLNGQIVTGSSFYECKMTGSYLGSMIVRQSVLSNLSGLSGVFKEVGISGTMVSAPDSLVLLWDVSPIETGAAWTMDMNSGASSQVTILETFGEYIVSNMDNAADKLHIHGGQGSITLASSCVDGVIEITGNQVVTDNSGIGCIVNVIPVQVDTAVIGAKIETIYAANKYRRKWDKTAKTITVYESDDVTPRDVFDTNADMSEITPQ